MNNISVVGAQWGDEGKGKVVDLLTGFADVVVRFSGGANAGHTLVVAGQQVIVHLLPSGVIHREKTCVLGDGMVIDLSGLLEEMPQLEPLNLRPTPESLKISARAHLVLPYHRELDRLRESGRRAIGTTLRGIGPAYEDRAARRGCRVCDLLHPDRLRERLRCALEVANLRIQALGGQTMAFDPLEATLVAQAEQLRPFIVDTSLYLQRAMRANKRMLFEGAQGILLDIDHGTYPYVTSSTTLAGGACGGAGVGPHALGDVIGVTKAYVTRVGEGPFPSEAPEPEAEALRKAGHEFGATTGRPRRCGWLDLPALRYAARVAGMRYLALTKLDVLANFDRPTVCVAYQLDGQRIDSLPPDAEDLAKVEPVLQEVEGFGGDLRGVSDFQGLPAGARDFVAMIERETDLEVCLLSVGPQRDQTILRRAFR